MFNLRKIKKFLFIFLLPFCSLIAKEYSSKNFDYLLGKTPGLDKQLLEMHFSLYRGYVANTNTLIESLRALEANGKRDSLEYGALKRRFGWEYDGMVLHELYFANLGFTEKLSSRDALYKQIVRDFGSYQNWEANFKATGLIRGIGWVILYKDPIDGHLYNVWVNEHDGGHVAGGAPILVMDVWEHAYITEFGLDRGKYIDTFFKNVNWDEVSKRYTEAGRLSPLQKQPAHK